ncbi:MAG: CCA tRNA nucleotidyltransferase [Clostridium sp.]|nr:CCA tRNA nucleotidyltransferase [Clostridium sp.]
MLITIPKDVKYIIDTFYNNGYEAFMVGGCIRDSLLKKVPMDYDIATSAPPEITQKLFKKSIPTGIEHGTITVLINKNSYEVTTYRVEGKYSNNRKPDSVTFISNIKDDLARRDFTINAFAYNDRKGLLDYFSGNTDLNNKIIKCVGNPDKRFKEDSLRMLRAIRFSAQLNFNIDETTFSAIKSNSKSIQNISNERIRVELSKILLSNNAFSGLLKLENANLLKEILPYNLNINKAIDKLEKDLASRFAFIFLKLDCSLIETIMRNLTFDKNTINKVIHLTTAFENIKSIVSKSDCKRLIIKVGNDNIFSLINLYETVTSTHISNINSLVKDIFKNKDALYIKDLSITGNDLISELNINPGKLLGELLNHLLNQVIDEKISNDYNCLIKSAKQYIKNKSAS